MEEETTTDQTGAEAAEACCSASCLIPSRFDSATLTRAASGCLENLGSDPDLVVAFVSSDYRAGLPELLEILRIDGHATRIVGTSAGGVFGVGKEQENASGVSLLFLKMPQVTLTTSMTSAKRRPEANHSAPAGFLLFGNPVQSELHDEIAKSNTNYPGVPVGGGLATGGPEPEDLFLFTEDGLSKSPMLSVRFDGPIRIEPLVAQSCRPIGEPFVVTGTTSDNVVSIGRRKAFSVLEDAFEALPEELQAEAEGSIFAGLAVQEEVENFDTGNFLIRHILSANLKKGWLQLATTPRVGQTMQFQLRDAASSEAVLREQSVTIREAHGSPFAAVLCSGQGRGRKLYGAEDREIRILEEHLGSSPMAGLFSNGEFGPIAGRNFRHDHSLCGALFYPDLEES
jgi:small ligand-binding sensory domain FIST